MGLGEEFRVGGVLPEHELLYQVVQACSAFTSSSVTNLSGRDDGSSTSCANKHRPCRAKDAWPTINAGVDGWPYRITFSRAEASLMVLSGMPEKINSFGRRHAGRPGGRRVGSAVENHGQHGPFPLCPGLGPVESGHRWRRGRQVDAAEVLGDVAELVLFGAFWADFDHDQAVCGGDVLMMGLR